MALNPSVIARSSSAIRIFAVMWQSCIRIDSSARERRQQEKCFVFVGVEPNVVRRGELVPFWWQSAARRHPPAERRSIRRTRSTCPATSRLAPTVTSSASATSARAVSPSAATNICSASYTTSSDPPPAVAIAPYSTSSGCIAIRKSTGLDRGRANASNASTSGIARSSSLAAAVA